MSNITLPGLIDIHTHMREPGATHKEDWDSGTSAALAGGITMVLAMPNTNPAIIDAKSLDKSLKLSRSKARCDYGQFVGASIENSSEISSLAEKTAGMKMYLDHTFGSLMLPKMTDWIPHFEEWPNESPIAVHAEGRTLASAILMASIFNRPIHLCHVSTKEEIILIRAAKEKGLKVTCEVCPHHLFLSQEDISKIGKGRSEVRPRLAAPEDREALWHNLDVIDCFSTDHAPHTLQEKDGEDPPPGFPGLESILPLLLNAVNNELLSIDDIILRMHINPAKIFDLPEQRDTYIEIDMDQSWEIKARNLNSRCGWTPFEGWEVRGQVVRVVLRGEEAFKEGKILSPQGAGKDVRQAKYNS